MSKKKKITISNINGIETRSEDLESISVSALIASRHELENVETD